MKKRLVIMALILAVFGVCLAQSNQNQDPAGSLLKGADASDRTRDLLLKYVDRCDRLEIQVNQQASVLNEANKLINDVLKVKTVAGLDSVLAKYGLERKK